MNLKQSVGLDVSSREFKTAFDVMDSQQRIKIKATHSFENGPAGFKELDRWVQKHSDSEAPITFTMEATGVYYENLAWHLHQKGCMVSVVLPNKARKYMQSLGLKSKNDKIDAKGLALMGAQQQLKPWKPVCEQLLQLRLLTRHLESLQRSSTMFGNQAHALEHSRIGSKLVKKHLGQSQNSIKRQVDEVKTAITSLVEKDDQLWPRIKNICKIKGVSVLTVAVIVAETNGFATFENQRQLVSYAGYDIVENQSGKHVGKTRISKKGNSHIRRALHMPALSVVRHRQLPFVDLYNRVYERTKIKMKAYVAVQKKLLTIIYALWKKNEAFDENYQPKITSGNEESNVLFPLSGKEGNELNVNGQKQIVPQQGGTTQDGHRCNESPNVLFRSANVKNFFRKKFGFYDSTLRETGVVAFALLHGYRQRIVLRIA
jgi:transposase